jgi:hypothetical protein
MMNAERALASLKKAGEALDGIANGNFELLKKNPRGCGGAAPARSNFGKTPV